MATQLSVFLRRHLRAERPRVFEAFTNPHRLTKWFSPSDDIGTEVLEHDLREGGRYRLRFHLPDGTRNVVIGEFKEVHEPSRLVFTWTWEPPDPHAGDETVVTIELEEVSDGTDILVTHERFPSWEARDRHDSGWQRTLDRLTRLLER